MVRRACLAVICIDTAFQVPFITDKPLYEMKAGWTSQCLARAWAQYQQRNGEKVKSTKKRKKKRKRKKRRKTQQTITKTPQRPFTIFDNLCNKYSTIQPSNQHIYQPTSQPAIVNGEREGSGRLSRHDGLYLASPSCWPSGVPFSRRFSLYS